MKKGLVCCMATLLFCILTGGSCTGPLRYISDGDFQYYYIQNTDSYAVIGATEQGRQREILYFPAYYKTKSVTRMGYSRPEGLWNVYNTYWFNGTFAAIRKAYFPYTVAVGYIDTRVFRFYEEGGEFFFANTDETCLRTAVSMANINRARYYVTPSAYEYIINDAYTRDDGDIHKANTSYLFNYKNAPNGGYFFINEFDDGGLIEDTPYAPRRNGYAFGGWYKDPEGTSPWDFGADTLPQARYNESGEKIYCETKLYAKWL